MHAYWPPLSNKKWEHVSRTYALEQPPAASLQLNQAGRHDACVELFGVTRLASSMDPVAAALTATLSFICSPAPVAAAVVPARTRARAKPTEVACWRADPALGVSLWLGHPWRPRVGLPRHERPSLPVFRPASALREAAKEAQERRSSGFPHNTSDFRAWRARGDYYRDNTKFVRFIDGLVDSPHVALYRPTRFGKSLLCSMMTAYYDVANADAFDELFGGLEIGAQPTEHASQYYVLELDLAVVPSGAWTVTDAFDEVKERINKSCSAFKKRYGLSFDVVANAIQSVANACMAVAALETNNLFIIVDEYDRLPNAVISEGPGVVKDYEAIMRRDTEAAKLCGKDEHEQDGGSFCGASKETWYACASPIRSLTPSSRT